jgi:glycosyltransferase involved in cell wall biosynthesis
MNTSNGKCKPRILILGVFLDDLVENVVRITNALQGSVEWSIEISWMANGVSEIPESLRFVTSLESNELISKFDALNALLDLHDIDDYEAVLLIDDDITINDGWLDLYLNLQFNHDFSLAQPARDAGSYIDHPFTQQLLGIGARETRFVEIGPVVSVTRAAYDVIFPLDTSWPMGWGLDYLWPISISSAGLSMGIIDRAPVRHALREPQSLYSSSDARHAQEARNENVRDLPRHEAQVIIPNHSDQRSEPKHPEPKGDPAISVVIATRNRSTLLSQALAALSVQTCSPMEFEVVIVDDGSTDDTKTTALAATGICQLTYLKQECSGLASARNHGLFAARGSVVLFLDDDDIPAPNLLEAHLLAHAKYASQSTAILGYTGLGGLARQSALMRHIVDKGSQLFSYGSLAAYGHLDYMHFWGGRTSVKRSLLLEKGIFDQRFKFGAEDIELGYRLSKEGFKVVYVPEAVSWMQRSLSWQDFLDRTEKQGRAYAELQFLHPESDLINRLGISSAFANRNELLRRLETTCVQVADLLEITQQLQKLSIPLPELAAIRLGSLIDAAYWGTLLRSYEEHPK